jgi:hypothetical protein
MQTRLVILDPEDDLDSVDALRIDIRPPADRHYPNRLRLNSPAKSQTTIILPGTDVAGDMAGIRSGQATIENNRYTINGRTYGRTDNGTLYPISGEGFIGPVGRAVFKALIAYRRYNGINDLAEFEISNQPFISNEDRTIAQRIWRLREETQRDADSGN